MRITLFLLSALAAISYADWVAIGPNGGPVYSGGISTTASPVIYLAPYATPTALIKSTDGGNTWGFTSGQISTYPMKILVHPTNSEIVYALTGSAIYKTTNGGASWSVSSVPSYNYFRTLTFNPLNPEVIYAVGYNYASSIYRAVLGRTTDAGASWQVFYCDTASSSGYSLDVDPIDTNVIYVGGYRGTTGATMVYRSTNRGETWEEIPIGVNGYYPYAIHVSPTNNNILLVAPYASGIYRSTNRGTTWTRVSTITYVYQIAVDQINPAVIYATTSTNVYKSTDTGTTWSAIGTGIPGSIYFALLTHPTVGGTVYCGTKAGLFRSTNYGNTWQNITEDFSFNKIKVIALAEDGNTIYTECQDNAVFRSPDNGTTWERCSEFLSCGNICAMVVNPLQPATVWALEGSG